MNYILNNKIKFEKNKHTPVVNQTHPVTILTRSITNTMRLERQRSTINKNFADIPSSISIDFKLKNYQNNSLNLINSLNAGNQLNQPIQYIQKNNSINQVEPRHIDRYREKTNMPQSAESVVIKNYYNNKFIINIYGMTENNLNNKKLYDFLLEFSKNIEIKIYIHTWNIDKNIINFYFEGLNVVSTIIDTSPEINMSECIFSSTYPSSYWKMMWTSMFRSINEISKNEDNKTIILNTRFDINYYFDYKNLLKLIKNKFTKNIFLKNSLDLSGVDNPIIGDSTTLNKLIHSFYNNSDNISMFYSSFTIPEASIYYENNRIFGVNYKEMFENIEKYSK
jgi:hypothetical protein